MWRFKPSSLGSSPRARPNQLGEMQDRHVELAADDAFGDRLLEVEVQVAQGARRHEAVGVGVDGVAEVAAGLLERGLLVHRDDREAAALAHPGVLDHGAAERVDHLVQVVVAGVLCVDAQAIARTDDVAAVEGADLEVRQRALDFRAQRVEADLLDEQPQEVLVRQAELVGEPLGGERLVDVASGTRRSRPGVPGTPTGRPGRSSRCSSSAPPRRPAGRGRRCAR